MIQNPYKGVFVDIEGIDGAGKTTQVTRASQWLKAHIDLAVSIEKEPTTGPWGRQIRQVLADKAWLEQMSGVEFQELYAYDGLQHMIQDIRPALKRGEIVIADRWRTSSFVYSANDEKEMEEYIELNERILEKEFIWPDIIFILDLPVEGAIRRMQKQGKMLDGIETDRKRLKRTRRLYLKLPKKIPSCVVVDASGTEEEIFEQIRKPMKAVLQKKGVHV